MIRLFKPEDAKKASNLIARALREVNAKDYDEEYIEADVRALSSDNLIKRAENNHLYICEREEKIVGIGGIGAYWFKEDESRLMNIFVLPDYHGQGIGTEIVKAIEQDIYFTRAKRIEVPSSITAAGFYLKLGYQFKNGIKEIDKDRLYRLEKFNE